LRRSPPEARALLAPALFALALLALPGATPAQSAFRHRDADGQWVFTDRAGPAAAAAGESIALGHEPEALQISVTRTDTGDMTQLIAASNCLCVVTLRVSIEQSDFAQVPRGGTYLVRLEPRARGTVLEARRSASGNSALRYAWKAALGSPEAVHNPARPYRVPFALGETFTVSQAYPLRITHVTPDSQYAVDIALPDGTPVYAARAGLVINLRHDSFRSAAAPAMLDQANMIEILHDDGTIAVYAHLQWDSIRVRIGQHVQLGEYIANSGNTGFTTGPHLHFAVWRNDGAADVSIPVQFAGAGGVAVTPQTAVPLTAY
jgi:murein DD-endopeptidase MepM/ murein hydrolase activator NlpD